MDRPSPVQIKYPASPAAAKAESSYVVLWVIVVVIVVMLLILTLRPRYSCNSYDMMGSRATYKTNVDVKGCSANTKCVGDCAGFQYKNGAVAKCSVGPKASQKVAVSTDAQTTAFNAALTACNNLESYVNMLNINSTVGVEIVDNQGVYKFKNTILSLNVKSKTAPVLFYSQNNVKRALPVTFVLNADQSYDMQVQYLGNADDTSKVGVNEYILEADANSTVTIKKPTMPLAKEQQALASAWNWIAKNGSQILVVKTNPALNITSVEWQPLNCSLFQQSAAAKPSKKTVNFGLAPNEVFTKCVGDAVPIDAAIQNCVNKGCAGIQGDAAAGYQICSGATVPIASTKNDICNSCASLLNTSAFSKIESLGANMNAESKMRFVTLPPAVYKNIKFQLSQPEQKIKIFCGLNAQTTDVTDMFTFVNDSGAKNGIVLQTEMLFTERLPPVMFISSADFVVYFNSAKGQHDVFQKTFRPLAVTTVSNKIVFYIKASQNNLSSPITFAADRIDCTQC